MISQILNVSSNKVVDNIKDEFGRIVYEAWKKLPISGLFPLTLNKCKGVDLVDYKIYGDSVQAENMFKKEKFSKIEDFTETGSSGYKYKYITGLKPNTAYRVTINRLNNTIVNSVKTVMVISGSIFSVGGGQYTAISHYGISAEDNGSPFTTDSKGRLTCGAGFSGTYALTQEKLDQIWANTEVIITEEGTQITPTPDAPIEIKCVGEYDEATGKYKIPVKVSGKNIINVPDVTKEGIGATNALWGLLYPNTRAGKYTFSADIKVEGYQGTGSALLAYGYQTEGDTNNTYGNVLVYSNYKGEGRYSVSFTANKKLTFFYVFISGSCKAGTVTVKNSMLAVDNEDIIYEKYVEPVTTNIYLDKPLRKTDDVVDYIDYETQTVNSQIDEITFNGTEEWKTNTNLSGVRRFYTPILNAGSGWNNNRIQNQCKCSHFDTSKSLGQGNSQLLKNLAVIYDNNAWFYTDPTMFPDLDTWKTWLASNNIKLQYKKSTKATTKINLPNIPTHKGTTILEVDTTIQPSNAEVKYMGKPN